MQFVNHCKRPPAKYRFAPMFLVMKLTAIFLLALVLNAGANSYSQRVTLDLKDVPLAKVIKEISRQSGFAVLYNNDLLRKASGLVSVKVKDVEVGEAISRSLSGTGLSFKIMQSTIVISPAIKAVEIRPELSFALVRGIVTDREGKPVASVTVTNVQSKRSAQTAADGTFSIAASENDVLEFTSVGYKMQRYAVAGVEKYISIILEPSTIKLDDMVVVGYGSVKRRDLTGSVSSVSAEEVRNVPYTSIDQALAGKASGVQVIQADGSPGAATRIRIRGGASLLGSNDPLYIIDGVPVIVQDKYIESVAEIANPVETYYGEDFNTISGTFARGLNSLSVLNINDIETIDILKDASATAIYGSKAANGVVVITTKKGKQNTKPLLEANYYAGFTTPLKEKVLNAAQYKAIMKEGATTLNTERERTGRAPNATSVAIVNDPDFFGKYDTDWLGMVLRNGFAQDASISVKGGGPGSRYYTSLAYTKQTGTLIGTDFNRVAGKISLDNDISSRFRILSNLDYGFTTNNITNGVYAMALFAPPTESPYNTDGSYSNLGSINTAYQGYQNPLAVASGINQAKSVTLLGSISGEYDITANLKFRSVVSVNYGTYKQLNYVPSYVKINSFYGSVSSNGGTGSQGSTESVNSFFENTLTWDKSFNADHHLTALAGTSWERYTASSFSAAGSGYPDDDFLNNLSSAAIPVKVTGSNPSRQNALLSFYLRANYTFKGRYLFTFTGRSDRSSKFAPANQVGYFPSGAFAWRISDENFMQAASSWVDELKLRISAGLTGTQNIGDHLFRTLYTPVAYAGTNALIPSQLGNDKIKWESTMQKDLGLDYSLFQGKLRGTFGYYEKETDGLLLNITTAPSSAYGSVILNIATIRNRGLEMDIQSDIIKTKDFTWNLALNISRNVSKVLDIQGGPFSDPNDRDALNLGTSIVKEGEPLGLLYGRVSEGIIKTQKDLDDYKAAFSYWSLITPYLNLGDSKFALDPDGLGPGIAYYSNDIIGHASPDFYGGITNAFSYKNLSLITLFTFSYGNDLIYQSDVANGTVDNLANRGVAILDHYSASNTASNRPRLIYSSQYRPLSNESVYDASYLKLKSIVLSYQLPGKVANHLKLKTTSFYISAMNLFTLTSYPGLDPEVSDDPGSVIGGGRDISSYPTSRACTIGLRIGF